MLYLSHVGENRLFAYAKTKTQISFEVTAKLISAFVFATLIVQSLYFLNPKFQASSHLLWLYRPVCVRPGRKHRRQVFSQRGSFCILQTVETINIESKNNVTMDRMTLYCVPVPGETQWVKTISFHVSALYMCCKNF